MPIGLLIGLGGGLVSALLFTSASSGSLLGVLVLFLLSPMPVAITGLGWGWQSAAIASVAGAVAVALAFSGRAAALYFLALGLPIVILSYLCLLGRPVEGGPNGATGKVEWYPIGRVVTVAAVWGGLLATLALFSVAGDIDGLRAVARSWAETFASILTLNAPPGATPFGENEITALTEYSVIVFPSVVATSWLAMALTNLWLGGLVARQSGRLVRPWPELSMVALPRTLPLAFAIAIALTFLPGYPGLIASGFAGALMLAFMLVGLAIIHCLTRALPARGLVLGAVYASLIFPVTSPFSSIVLAGLGLAEPVSPFKRRPRPTVIS